MVTNNDERTAGNVSVACDELDTKEELLILPKNMNKILQFCNIFKYALSLMVLTQRLIFI